jgi:hypothetical protein
MVFIQMEGEHLPPAKPDAGLAETKGGKGRTQDVSGYGEELTICFRSAAAFAWEQRR